MRILVGFDLGVVLAVDGDPFLGHLARREPQPQAEKMADGRMEVEATVGLAAMQVNRDGDDGDMRQHQRYDDIAPQR